ncbi:hypothetical protein ACGFWI_37860 [Streptomyces sp. NPDC048434]|uniref:hypothetical protein n=1 Tax=Streptomyces sp. NPDC048434 TaxID=3365549 RepID=UPI00371E0B47
MTTAAEAGEQPDVGVAPDAERRRPRKIRIKTSTLKPYTSTGDLVGAVGAGSLVLLGKGWTWVTAEDWRTALTRLGGTLGGTFVAIRAASEVDVVWGPWLVPAAAAGWCVVAVIHSPSAKAKAAKARARAAKARAEATKARAEAVGTEAAEAAAVAAEAEAVAAKAEAVAARAEVEDRKSQTKAGGGIDLTKGHSPADDQEHEGQGDGETVGLEDVAPLIVAAAGKRAGVHLREVLAHDAAAAGLLEGWTVSDLRTALEEVWEVPCEPNMGYRVDGRPTTTVGVRVEALPAPLRGGGQGRPAGTPSGPAHDTSAGTPSEAPSGPAPEAPASTPSGAAPASPPPA